jgi:hypothetical protein
MITKNHIKDKLRGTWLYNGLNRLRSIKRQVMRKSDGERFLLEQYLSRTGKRLPLENPETFSEKLYCRMISINRGEHPQFTELVDKYAVRAYVTSRIGERHLVKLLWNGIEPRDIPFASLPNNYVIKANHGSGLVIVVKGEPDRLGIVDTTSAWLRTNYYWGSREYQYFHIKPRILVEEYLNPRDGNGPLDFRFWCFNGEPEVIQVDNHAHNINPFFDPDWNLLDLHYREGASRPPIARPANFEEMMSIASRLSAPFDFVRVDLYNIDGRICFGELTFTPAGSLKFQPNVWDKKLGEKWKISFTA